MPVTYSWRSFFQGFLLDIEALAANADPAALILCFLILAAAFIAAERKRLCLKNILFAVIAAAYGTFIMMMTVLGRLPGYVSGRIRLFSIYERAFTGDFAAIFDVLYNIILFVPAGILAARYRRTKAAAIALLCIPLCIEIAQLVTARGVFECSDIVNNFIGGMIGLLIGNGLIALYDRARRSLKKKKQQSDK